MKLFEPLIDHDKRDRRALLISSILLVLIVKYWFVPKSIQPLGITIANEQILIFIFLLKLIVFYFLMTFLIPSFRRFAEIVSNRRSILEAYLPEYGIEEKSINMISKRKRGKKNANTPSWYFWLLYRVLPTPLFLLKFVLDFGVPISLAAYGLLLPSPILAKSL